MRFRDRRKLSRLIGPAFVAAAAFLWATDALVRLPSVGVLDPLVIVYLEHAVGLLLLLPWVPTFQRKALLALSQAQWLAAAGIGVGGSAVATVLFTASFRYLNPSLSILLQKLQPLIVVALAYLFLGERPSRRFYPWAALALAAAIVLGFPTLDFSELSGGPSPHLHGIGCAVLAAALWAAATVAGKVLLKGMPSTVGTFWRFAFGFIALQAVVIQSPFPWSALAQPGTLAPLGWLIVGPGLGAMLFYYAGLGRTTASTTTFVELIFPVSAVVLNTVFLNAPITPVQWIAGAVLVFAVTRASLT